jgi:DNA-binding CsgD family transcriptional regulator
MRTGAVNEEMRIHATLDDRGTLRDHTTVANSLRIAAVSSRTQSPLEPAKPCESSCRPSFGASAGSPHEDDGAMHGSRPLRGRHRETGHGIRPLRGRHREMGALRAALSEAAAGRSGSALVLGPHGYGKSRLVREFGRTAEQNGFLVVPFGAEDLEDDRELTDRRVLSVLDDNLLSADPDMFCRVRAALARRRDRPWLTLITLRSGAYGLEGHRFVSGLEEAGGTRIELQGLDRAAVQEVMTDALGAPPDAGLLKLADTAAGNPLLVVSLAQGLLEDGQVAIREGLAAYDQTVVPGRLRTTVTCMLNELDQDTQQLVRTAAALGPSCSVDSLVAVFTASAGRLAACVQQAIDAGLIERRGDELGFRYELVRWVIAEETPPTVRQKLFEEAASALRGGLDRPQGHVVARTSGSVAERFAGHDHTAEADRAATLPRRIRTHMLEGRLEEAHDLAISLLVTSRPFGDTTARVQALLALAASARLGGQPSVALRRGREAASLALGMRDRGAFARLAPVAALELSLLGESEVPQWLLESADFPLPSHLDAAEPAADVLSGLARTRLLLRRGETALAVQAAEDIADVIDAGGLMEAMPVCWAVQAQVALRSGQAVAAERLVARYKWNERRGAVWGSPLPDWVALQVATERQGPMCGSELLGGRHAHLIATPVLFIEEPGAAPWMVRTALAAGATGLARAVTSEVRRLADANPGFVPVAASALHAEGLWRRDPELLGRAEREHRDPWAAASAAEDLLGLLEGMQAPDRLAIALGLARARHEYERAGDLLGAERIRRALAELGQAPAPEPRAGVQQPSLSGSERAVTELVVRGMTNRQVGKELDLSPNTVNFHLRNVYRKFGIGSRVELARLYQSAPPADGVRW